MGPWSKIDGLRRRVAETPIAEFDSSTIKSVEDAQSAIVEKCFVPERLVVLGWEVFLSRRRQDGIVHWHLSTKLHPHRRSATKSDWEIVGRIAARVGAPRDPVVMPDDPCAAIHWSWTDGPTA